MRLRTGITLVVVVVLAVAVAFAGSSKARTTGHAGVTGGRAVAASTPRIGGTLHVGIPSDVDSLDPLHVTGGIDEVVAMWTIYDTLMKFNDPRKAPVPDLATSLVPNKTDTVWTVHLRHGVRFQDGTPFNAAAVKFNVQREMNPADASIIVVQPIKSMDIVDQYTIKFNLKFPWLNFPYAVTFPPFLMASPTAVKKYGANYANHPAGTGPYEFVSRRPGSEIVLKRFSGWWGKGIYPAGYLNSIRYQVIPNATSMYDSLQSGALDIALDATPNDIKEGKSHGLHFSECPVAGQTLINFNLKSAPAGVDNALVRRAMSYAVDRKALNQLVNGGITPLFNNPFDGSPWANTVKFPATYNLAMAKTLMQQYQTQVGHNQPATVGIDVIGADGVTLGDALQQMWAKIGVNTTVRQVDFPTQIGDLLGGKFQAMQFSSSIWPNPDFVFYAFTLSSSPLNLSKTSPPQVDAGLNSARTALTLAKQTAGYKTVTQWLAGSAPWIYLLETLNGYMYGSNVAGPALSPNAMQTTCTPEVASMWLSK